MSKLYFIGLYTFFFIAFPACVQAEQTAVRTVIRVIDGDTIELDGGEKVRLIGIDCPESRGGKKLDKDAARTGQDTDTIKELGKAATNFVRSLCLNKTITLEYDQTLKDKYGRTLAYVQLSGGRILNEEILKAGYAMPYTKFPFRNIEKYVALGKEAREAKLGLWAKGME